jgi:hypothetical protein
VIVAYGTSTGAPGSVSKVSVLCSMARSSHGDVSFQT